jgi:uncharacterized membrane protein YvlD (DUF360 family)
VKKIEDERIINEKRRINSHAFSIFFIGLWLIIIYRQLILEQDISQYWDIFALTLGGSFFVVINNVLKGLFLTYRKKKERNKVTIIGAIVGAITFSVVNSFMNELNLSNAKDITTMVISAVVFLVVWLAAHKFIVNKSIEKANEEIEE